MTLYMTILVSWEGRGLMEKKDWDDLTNVQYKPNWNCHYESPP
jgi:hypothetical protein